MIIEKIVDKFGRVGLLVFTIAWVSLIYIAANNPSNSFLAHTLLPGLLAVIIGSMVLGNLITRLITAGIKKHGVVANAGIIEVRHTGGHDKTTGLPYLKVLLEVMPEREPPFQAWTRSKLYGHRDMHTLQAGAVIRVMYNPNRRSQVIIHDPGEDAPATGTTWATGPATLGSGSAPPSGAEAEALEQLMAFTSLQADLRANGEEASAIILSTRETEVKLDGTNPLMSFELAVNPENRPAFTAQAQGLIAQQSLYKVQPGMPVTVHFDPSDLSRVTLTGAAGPVLVD